MINSLCRQTVSLGLAAVVTLSVLFGLNGLAHSEYRSAQQLAQAAGAPRA